MQENVFVAIARTAAWREPETISDNAPTVSCVFRESSTINLVVADLLRIYALHNQHHALTPSVFYHLDDYNTMVDD